MNVLLLISPRHIVTLRDISKGCISRIAQRLIKHVITLPEVLVSQFTISVNSLNSQSAASPLAPLTFRCCKIATRSFILHADVN